MSDGARTNQTGASAAGDYFNSLPQHQRKLLAPLLEEYRLLGLQEASEIGPASSTRPFRYAVPLPTMSDERVGALAAYAVRATGCSVVVAVCAAREVVRSGLQGTASARAVLVAVRRSAVSS